MKRTLFFLFLMAPSLACAAQTTTTLNLTATPAAPFSCFSFTAQTPNCYGLPVLNPHDGSEGRFWIDDTFIQFLGDYEQLNGKQGWAEITRSEVGNGTAAFDFEGTDDSGRGYTGSLIWSFTTHR
jgi:hypothetical protein